MKDLLHKLKLRPRIFRDILIIIAAFCVALLGFLVLISDFNSSDSSMQYHQRQDLVTDNWRITTNTINTTTSLPLWVDAEPGEVISLSKKIPILPSPHSVFVTRNYHQKLAAYIDGSKIYDFPKDSERMSSAVITDDWNMIEIPTTATFRKLTIEFTVGSAPFHGYIEPIFMGEDNAIMSHLQNIYKAPYILSVALMAIGLLLIVIAIVYSRNFSDKHSFLLGLVFIAVGIWFADRSKMPIFVVGSNVKFFVAFSVLTLVPLLLALYTGERFKEHNQSLPNILTFTAIGFDVLMFTLVAAKVTPIHSITQYVYLVILIYCIYLTYLLWYYSYGKGRIQLKQVNLNAVRMEFLAAMATIAGSIASLVWDAISSNNWSSSQREWTGVGTIQIAAVAIFGFAHLIILLYTSYYGVLESETMQKKLHDSQLQLMMGQIQPHFMFNTLSSIRTLIKIDPDVAYDMVYNFSNYLRANVDNLTNLKGILLSAEIEHIKNYVNIEQIRFGDRLNVEYDIKEMDFIVPPLAIQPLVENAIKHGVCKKADGGTVWIRSYKDGKDYIVEVQDDGVGIPPDRLQSVLYGDASSAHDGYDVSLTGNASERHQSTGMRNIILRLKEMCNADLEITSKEGEGTLMKVVFPIEGQPKGVDPEV